ncbi:hypothetical protein J7K18_02350 [bacterium]|nr:hypothetical protein [bacterium]
MRYYKGIMAVGAVVVFALILSGCQTVLRTHSRVVIADPPDIVVDDCCCCCCDWWWDDCCCWHLCCDHWWLDTYCWHCRCFWHPVVLLWYLPPPSPPYYYPYYPYYYEPPPVRYRGSYTTSGYRITRRRGLFREPGESTSLLPAKYRSAEVKRYTGSRVASSVTQVASAVGGRKILPKSKSTGSVAKIIEKTSTENSTRKKHKKDNSTTLRRRKNSPIGLERNKKSLTERSKEKKIPEKGRQNLFFLRKDDKEVKSTKIKSKNPSKGPITKRSSIGYSSKGSFRATAARGSSTRVKLIRRGR